MGEWDGKWSEMTWDVIQCRDMGGKEVKVGGGLGLATLKENDAPKKLGILNKHVVEGYAL